MPPSTHARHEKPAAASEAIEDYAKAIYALAALRAAGGHQRAGHPPGVAPATATAMLKRLDGMGLVHHQPYHGVSLTPAGERVALEVIRHHRLLESYLSEALGMPWDRVHEEAEVLEHYISEELEELIAAKLGEPSHDPHGDPIPGRTWSFDEAGSRPLEALEDGETATFTRVSDSDSQMLRYLAERGIRPGARVMVKERQPFGGPLFVEVDGAEQALGGELVRRMRVSVAEQAR